VYNCIALQDVYYEKDEHRSKSLSARTSRDAAMEEGQEVSMSMPSSSSNSRQQQQQLRWQ
jgi:hypothetical protein